MFLKQHSVIDVVCISANTALFAWFFIREESLLQNLSALEKLEEKKERELER